MQPVLLLARMVHCFALHPYLLIWWNLYFISWLQCCEVQPPEEVIKTLIVAYLPAMQIKDSGDILPLHLLCHKPATANVTCTFLWDDHTTARFTNNKGQLPLHLVCWQGASINIVFDLLEIHHCCKWTGRTATKIAERGIMERYLVGGQKRTQGGKLLQWSGGGISERETFCHSDSSSQRCRLHRCELVSPALFLTIDVVDALL